MLNELFDLSCVTIPFFFAVCFAKRQNPFIKDAVPHGATVRRRRIQLYGCSANAVFFDRVPGMLQRQCGLTAESATSGLVVIRRT